MNYSKELLQFERPQSMYDSEVHRYLAELLRTGENFAEAPQELWSKFKSTFHNWILASRLNQVHGLEAFPDRDIITGVTQFLDDLHQTRSRVVVIENEYRYHSRLLGKDLKVKAPHELESEDELILSMPFPFYGDVHPEMDAILRICNDRQVKVHIDACWYGCSRDIVFNFNQPCIQSVGFSLSKALGLGANRIGVRYARRRWRGPVSIHNDFEMNQQALVWIGLKFMERFGADFWQSKYGEAYRKVCVDFDLKPTKAIHLAWQGNRPVGVRPLLRELVK